MDGGQLDARGAVSRMQDVWSAVDAYVCDTLHAPDPVLDAALADSAAAGLPAISVTPPMGKLLWLLAQARQARRVLEIGTLGGYSTIWLARAVGQDGRVVTLELDPGHAAVARRNLARANVDSRVELRLGPALDSLAALEAEGAAPFDLVFIDADKPSNPEYFAWALRLSRPGTVIVVDNVVRDGEVLDPLSADDRVQGVRRMHERMRATRGISATTLQTVGGKGYDGFTIAIVEGKPQRPTTGG